MLWSWHGLLPLMLLLYSGECSDTDRPRVSQRIEVAAGYTLGDIEDPAAQRLLAVLFDQIDEMEQEVAALKIENKDIRDRLGRTEERAETFRRNMEHKLDVLAREKDTGLLSESSLADGLGLLGVKNASLVAPILREQGLFSLTHLLTLDQPDRLELHHALQSHSPFPLSLTLRPHVPLARSLQSLGLQAPTSTAEALQSLGYDSVDDLLVVGENLEAKERLSDELRKWSASERGKQVSRLGNWRQKQLSIGDRRSILGLTDLGSLLHTSNQSRQNAQAAQMSSSTAAEFSAIFAENKRFLAHREAQWLWTVMFGRASALRAWLSNHGDPAYPHLRLEDDSYDQVVADNVVTHQESNSNAEQSLFWIAQLRTWVVSFADAADWWLPSHVVATCRMLWLQGLIVATGGVTTPWVQLIVILLCIVWFSTMRILTRNGQRPGPHGHIAPPQRANEVIQR